MNDAIKELEKYIEERTKELDCLYLKTKLRAHEVIFRKAEVIRLDDFIKQIKWRYQDNEFGDDGK